MESKNSIAGTLRFGSSPSARWKNWIRQCLGGFPEVAVIRYQPTEMLRIFMLTSSRKSSMPLSINLSFSNSI